MCRSAATLKKLISHRFLQCFVKVAFFRTRQSKHQFFTESSKFRPVFLIENSSRNRSEIDILEHSESDPILDRFLTPFWLDFGTIFAAFGRVLAGLGAHWPPFWPPGALWDRFPWVCLALLTPLGEPEAPFWSILNQFGPLWEPFWRPGAPF